MKLNPQEFPIPLPEGKIAYAEILDREVLSALMIADDSQVYLFEIESQSLRLLFVLPEEIKLDNISIYSYKEYCALVENRGIHGLVIHFPRPEFKKTLLRGEYQVTHCSFPIGFYGDRGQTFLLHGTEWNRLDITCLDTDELLTKREIDYETKTNYVNYFHSRLSISPNEKRFLSNGWAWHPVDVITCYDLRSFISHYELSQRTFDFPETTGYLWDRPLVWTNSTTVAIGYNKKEADEEGTHPSELIFINTNDDKEVKRIPFDAFGLNDYGEIEGQLFSKRSDKMLICLSKNKGLTIADYEGEVYLTDKDFVATGYSGKHGLFWGVKENVLVVTEIL